MSDLDPLDAGALDDEVLPKGSEADLLEQAQVVEEEQRRVRSEHRDDVPEADWLEQSVEEEIDDEER